MTTLHVTFSNHSDVALTRTDEKGNWQDGEPSATVEALTAVTWATDGAGSVTYSIGSDDAALTLAWEDAHGGAFHFDLGSGWELLGTVSNAMFDFHFSPTAPHTVDGFMPTTHGFAFPNTFPDDAALKTIDLGVTKLPIGKAANGLCGGMTFAARDFFEAGVAIPADTESPTGQGVPLFDFLVDRQIKSFDLPHLPETLMAIMSPAYPDHDGGLLGHFGADGRARLMARSEFAKIRAAIDSGKPCPICIIKAKSTNPAALGENHQILVYGYQVNGTQLTLWVYDPNNPGRDDAGLVLDIGRTDRTIDVSVSIDDLNTIYCYVVTNYAPSPPPAI